jgi:hypothetical protein
VQKNSASLSTKGWQVELGSVVLNGPFQWTSSLALNYTSSKITDYQIDDKGRTASGVIRSGVGLLMLRGKDPYGLFSFPFAGLDPENGDPRGYIGDKISKDYYALLQQAADTTRLVYHGSAIPRYYGNFLNTFSWKGFSLAVNVLYKLGFFVRKNGVTYEALFDNGIIQPEMEKRWRQKGDELFTNVPSMIYPIQDSYRDQFYNNSEANVIRGDNIRLQYVRLSYQVNKPVFGAKFIQSLELSCSANDLGFIWRASKDRLDPEFFGSEGRYLLPKNYTVGCRITF